MRSTGRSTFVLTVFSLLVMVVIAGCSEDKNECPVCPGSPAPTMDNLWPNEDGNSWTYDQMTRRWETAPWTLYEDPGDVPDAPSLDYVEARLDDHNTGANADTMFHIFRLEFDGVCEGDSGATGQCLVETLYDEWDDDIITVSFESALFNGLLLARPDLGNEIRNISGIPVEPGAMIVRPRLLLHGGIWEKTKEHIGTYGDVDTLLAWKYLESDISVGHEFSFELVPSLPGEVYMYCRVLSRGTVETEFGTYQNAVECLYLIDYGVADMQPPSGPRYFRLYDYGTITYAPGVGPVTSYERMLIDTTVPEGPGRGDYHMELIGTGSN